MLIKEKLTPSTWYQCEKCGKESQDLTSIQICEYNHEACNHLKHGYNYAIAPNTNGTKGVDRYCKECKARVGSRVKIPDEFSTQEDLEKLYTTFLDEFWF